LSQTAKQRSPASQLQSHHVFREFRPLLVSRDSASSSIHPPQHRRTSRTTRFVVRSSCNQLRRSNSSPWTSLWPTTYNKYNEIKSGKLPNNFRYSNIEIIFKGFLKGALNYLWSHYITSGCID